MCAAATRVRVEDAPKLVGLLSNGLADALRIERSRAAAGAAPVSAVTPMQRVRGALDRLLNRLLGRPDHGTVAKVVPMMRRQPSTSDDARKSADRQS